MSQEDPLGTFWVVQWSTDLVDCILTQWDSCEPRTSFQCLAWFKKELTTPLPLKSTNIHHTPFRDIIYSTTEFVQLCLERLPLEAAGSDDLPARVKLLEEGLDPNVVPSI